MELAGFKMADTGGTKMEMVLTLAADLNSSRENYTSLTRMDTGLKQATSKTK